MPFLQQPGHHRPVGEKSREASGTRGRLLTAIHEQKFADTDLVRMAYTLQVGREAMEERLAVIVGSFTELQEKLKGFVEGKEGIEDFYRGQVKRNKDTLVFFTADEDLTMAIETWIKRKYAKLVDLWVKGLSVDWNKLYGDAKNPSSHKSADLSICQGTLLVA